MSILIVISLLSSWFYFGWLILGAARLEDSIVRGLLAPAVGMAFVTLLTTTASLAGLPIKQSLWITVLMLGSSLFLVRRVTWTGSRDVAGLHLLIIAVNLCTLGIGLIVFGTSWQGFINGDAATNSLAAQYFIEHSFFSEPSIRSIAAGNDYSPLSSILYVAGGHRFGDVMLLGLSAALFRLNPDQVYMAHALAIQCTLVAGATLFLYQRGGSPWKLVAAIVSISLSPLGAYTYLNQLISGIGGLAMVVGVAQISKLVLDRPESYARMLWPLAVLMAALSQSYPESVPFLALGLFLFGVYCARRRELVPIRTIVQWGAVLSVVVLIFLNVSLPNVLSHLMRVMGWGAAKVTDSPIEGDFGYAFTPDFFPILFGFLGLREAVAEPWAISLQVVAMLLTGVLTIFAVRRMDDFPLLVSLCLAAVITFAFLFWQKSGFGTFKMMLLVQPLIFMLLAAVAIEVLISRNIPGIIVGLVLLLLVGRGLSDNLRKAMSPFGPVHNFAQNRILDKIEEAAAINPEGLIIESPTFLFGKFATLRVKEEPVLFETNVPAGYAIGGLKQLKSGSVFSPWLPDHESFSDSLARYYQDVYTSVVLYCGPPDVSAKYTILSSDGTSSGIRPLVPGGQMIPLNRRQYGDLDLMLLNNKNTKDVLAFRASTAGAYYGMAGPISLYYLEKDPLARSSMAAVGRYMLLEVLSPSSGELRLSMRFSRTYLGGQDARLPEITLYGAQPVRLGVAGAGSLSLVSPPLRPCVVTGRSYVLVDFGVEPRRIKKTSPWVYRLLNVPYRPDARLVTGFLRDISVVAAEDEKSLDNEMTLLRYHWDLRAFESLFEYSGMYEDGWMSDHVLLRPKGKLEKRRITFTLDIPGEMERQHASLFVQSGGEPIRQIPLVGGRINVHIDVSATTDRLINFTSDRPLVLPQGDGRSVIGILRFVSVE